MAVNENINVLRDGGRSARRRSRTFCLCRRPQRSAGTIFPQPLSTAARWRAGRNASRWKSGRRLFRIARICNPSSLLSFRTILVGACGLRTSLRGTRIFMLDEPASRQHLSPRGRHSGATSGGAVVTVLWRVSLLRGGANAFSTYIHRQHKTRRLRHFVFNYRLNGRRSFWCAWRASTTADGTTWRIWWYGQRRAGRMVGRQYVASTGYRRYSRWRSTAFLLLLRATAPALLFRCAQWLERTYIFVFAPCSSHLGWRGWPCRGLILLPACLVGALYHRLFCKRSASA